VANDVLSPGDRLVIVVGGFGSGKTEIAVNLALQLAQAGRAVQIADLDLVNPYFRCREARELLERQGVRVVVPPGPQAFADLPILLPEIRGMLRPPPGVVSILDVGGDDIGARPLAGFRHDLAEGDYELWQVLNPNRPFTRSVEACLRRMREIEQASRLRVTGFIANAHLLEETTVAVVLEGFGIAVEAAARTGVRVRAVALLARLALDPRILALPVPRLELFRRMVPPWLQGPDTAGLASKDQEERTHGTRSD
jgi:hypothetical protein